MAACASMHETIPASPGSGPNPREALERSECYAILCLYTVFGVVMFVKVAQMFEDGGRPISRSRAVTRQPVHVGKLSMSEQHDKQFRRSVCTAYLRKVGDGKDVLPPLRDAVVRWLGDGTLTISGIETDPCSGKCVPAQLWLAQLLFDEVDG